MDWGSTVPHGSGAPSPGTLGKSELYRALEEAAWKPGMTGKDLGVSLHGQQVLCSRVR